MKSDCETVSATSVLLRLGRPSVRARLQEADPGTVKEACGFAGLPEWRFSERLHPPVIGFTQIYERLFGQQWSRSTIDTAATCSQRQGDMAGWLAESGAAEEQWAELSGHLDLFEPARTYLVWCDAKVGPAKAHVKQLDALLHKEGVDGDSEPSHASMPRDKR